jgi:hypothetical protein
MCKLVFAGIAVNEGGIRILLNPWNKKLFQWLPLKHPGTCTDANVVVCVICIYCQFCKQNLILTAAKRKMYSAVNCNMHITAK